jgi:hypothetical protein
MYGVTKKDMVVAISSQKYAIKFSALSSWPMYLSYKEDVTTRSEKWGQKYLGV